MEMIRCKECGKEVPGDATVCPNCGYVLRKEGVPQGQPVQGWTPQPQPPVVRPRPAYGNGAWIAISIISFVIAGLTFLCGFDAMGGYSSDLIYALCFLIMAMMFSLMGVGFAALYYLSKR